VPEHIRRQTTIQETAPIGFIQKQLPEITASGRLLILSGGVGVGKTFALHYGFAYLRALEIEAELERRSTGWEHEDWREDVLKAGKPKPVDPETLGPMGSIAAAEFSYKMECQLWDKAQVPPEPPDMDKIAEHLMASGMYPTVIEARDLVKFNNDNLSESASTNPGLIAIDDWGSEYWRDEGDAVKGSWGVYCWEQGSVIQTGEHGLPLVL
jgi:hypothetical protein